MLVISVCKQVFKTMAGGIKKEMRRGEKANPESSIKSSQAT
jgi:hypothetical protein